MTEENNRNLAMQNSQQAIWANQEDEISLIDIGKIFWQNRAVFFAVLLAVSIAGWGYAMSIKPTYKHFMLVKIGSQASQASQASQVESIGDVKINMENLYIPNILGRTALDFEDVFEINPLQTKVLNQKTGKEKVFISDKILDVAILGTNLVSDENITILNEIFKRLDADHEKLYSDAIDKQKKRVEAASRALKVGGLDIIRLEQQISGLDGNRKMLKKQMQDGVAAIKRLESKGEALLKKAGSDVAAVSALLEGQFETRLMEAKRDYQLTRDKYLVINNEERDKALTDLDKLRVLEEELVSKLSKEEDLLSKIEKTEVIAQPSEEGKPVKSNKKLKVMVAAPALGFMLAIFVVLFRVFAQNMNRTTTRNGNA